jgi:hypothetical protein
MPTTPISAPIDPRRSAASTDQARSDTGWSTATGTVTIRRPEPLDTNSESEDSSFLEEQVADSPSLATL